MACRAERLSLVKAGKAGLESPEPRPSDPPTGSADLCPNKQWLQSFCLILPTLTSNLFFNKQICCLASCDIQEL